MNFTSKSAVKHLLKKYQVRPSKRLGQNFLIDNSVIKKVVRAANLQKDDIVLEIGPGIGNLTCELAEKTKRVIAVEKDGKMCEILKETLKNYKNVEIINNDVLRIGNWELEIDWKLGIGNWKLVANLPYYITSPAIRKFLEAGNQPKLMVLVVQKEVAQRICASPAKVFASQKFRRARPPKMNILAVAVQFYAETKILFYISKKSFWPQPEVDAAVLKIVPTKKRGGIDDNLFFKIVKAGFSQPRKQLANNLSKRLALSSPNGLKLDKKEVNRWLLKNNIQPSQRAETLTVEDWIKLTKMF